eukprot:gene25254-biopygen11981
MKVPTPGGLLASQPQRRAWLIYVCSYPRKERASNTAAQSSSADCLSIHTSRPNGSGAAAPFRCGGCGVLRLCRHWRCVKSWVPLGFTGLQRVLMGLPVVPVDPLASPWIPADGWVHGTTSPVDPRASPWIPVDPRASPWIPVHPRGWPPVEIRWDPMKPRQTQDLTHLLWAGTTYYSPGFNGVWQHFAVEPCSLGVPGY